MDSLKQLPALQQLRCEYHENPLGIGEQRPRLSWQINDPRRGAIQSAYQILVASSRESLEQCQGDVWDSGKIISDRCIHIEYGGPELLSQHRYYWKVRTWDRKDNPSIWSGVNWWEMGLLKPEHWQGVWISFQPKQPAAEFNPSPCFRRTFAVKNPLVRARVYATALGLYTLYINGQRVGDDIFTPGWTDYNKRIQYQTYDVTQMLIQGDNVIGAILGDGWYCGGYVKIELDGKKKYGDFPKLLVQLNIEYTDGSIDTIVTDGSWKVSTEWPILASDLLMGEIYDARLEVPGWNKPGFDDSKWQEPEIQEENRIPLIAQCSPTVQKTQELKPVSVAEPTKGTYVFDIGQNMVGWVRLKVRGNAGTKIRLRFAEMLNPDGTIYTKNLRKAKCTDHYILKGGGDESYEPSFTYHGFRYVEVTGYPGEHTLEAITGIVVHSATLPTGTFECSSNLVNQLQGNITWTQRGNFLSVPTDCPQRNERLGWTGDAQIFARTACFNMDVSAFFTKWMMDIEDAQTEDGAFMDQAPHIFGDVGNAGWGDAGIICPWIIYLCYGDTRILERHYEAMTRWIKYLKTKSKDLICPNQGYGDWLSINADTPKDLLAIAFFAHSTQLMSRIAMALDKTKDAQKYQVLFEEIKAAFNREYVTPNGRIVGNTQTVYVLALHFDLLPEEKRKAAAKHLVEDIEKGKCKSEYPAVGVTPGGHLSTGFVGAAYLLPVLTQTGHLDVAYRLLNNDTFPSWGYPIKHGATTIWERWDGWTEGKGFQDPSMNSFNHYAFGAVGEWLYHTIAGIDLDPAKPGYKHIVIRPHPGGGLRFANGEYHSIYGKIVSCWKMEDNIFELHLVIPANTEATVHIPAATTDQVTESGQKLSEARGISHIRLVNGNVVCQIGAGTYVFSSCKEIDG